MSLEDEIVRTHGTAIRGPVSRVISQYRSIGPWLGKLAVCWAQYAAERLHARKRRDLLKLDEQLEAALAFSGHFE
jgi:hypothetical protein